MLHKAIVLLAGSCAMLSACANNNDAVLSMSQIDAAVAAPIRTINDRDNDESRKPAEFLEFLGLREGLVVAEINAGPGYNVRLLTTAVGAEGRIYATNAEFVLEMFKGLNDRLSESISSVDNVTVSTQPDNRIDLPEIVDLAILNNNYHDLHWQEIDTAVFNQSVFHSIRPGGFFVLGDHHAPVGSGIDLVSSHHRIDREIIVSELQAAGFILVDSGDFLANSNDDRKKIIFDPAIRGNTDRFLLKFQRPE